MRISVLGLAIGITCTAALAVPMLPSHIGGDFWHMRSDYGVSEIASASARGLTNILSMAAMADEAETQAIDFDNLVRIDDREFDVTFDDSVSMVPLSQNSVRMISYGRLSTVKVVRTLSGTYSTAGLISPNIQYPGISVVEKTALETGNNWRSLQRGSWLPWLSTSGNSVVTYGRTMGGGGFVVSKSGLCSTGPGFSYCR